MGVLLFLLVLLGQVMPNGAQRTGKWHSQDSASRVRLTAKDSFTLFFLRDTGKIPEHPFLGLERGKKPWSGQDHGAGELSIPGPQEQQILWNWAGCALCSAHWDPGAARGGRGGGEGRLEVVAEHRHHLLFCRACSCSSDSPVICLGTFDRAVLICCTQHSAKSINSVTPKSISHNLKGADEETKSALVILVFSSL